MEETLLVIDGHKLDIESTKLNLFNDVRDIYDINLSKTIASLVGDETPVSTTSPIDNTRIKLDKNENQVYIKNKIIYNFSKNEEGFFINIYYDKKLLFSLKTNNDLKVDKKDFGIEINTPKHSFIERFSNRNCTTISNNLSNQIIKHVTLEKINGLEYLYYHEYFYNTNLYIKLLFINYIPVSLTMCSNNTSFQPDNFQFQK